MDLSIGRVKELILRCYRNTDPRELVGLKKVNDGYLTADHKWMYFIRHGGFIEREPPMMVVTPGEKPVPVATTPWVLTSSWKIQP